MDYKEFAKTFLPKDLLDYFEVTGIKEVPTTAEREEHYIITLEERNTLPEGLRQEDYESKGFYKPRLIQDFPLRGKAVYLDIHRRRWRSKRDKKNIHRDFTMIAAGTKFTQELSDFLKQAH
jgi:transposase